MSVSFSQKSSNKFPENKPKDTFLTGLFNIRYQYKYCPSVIYIYNFICLKGSININTKHTTIIVVAGNYTHRFTMCIETEKSINICALTH